MRMRRISSPARRLLDAPLAIHSLYPCTPIRRHHHHHHHHHHQHHHQHNYHYHHHLHVHCTIFMFGQNVKIIAGNLPLSKTSRNLLRKVENLKSRSPNRFLYPFTLAAVHRLNTSQRPISVPSISSIYVSSISVPSISVPTISSISSISVPTISSISSISVPF